LHPWPLAHTCKILSCAGQHKISMSGHLTIQYGFSLQTGLQL
jgi:hypothetical protein